MSAPTTGKEAVLLAIVLWLVALAFGFAPSIATAVKGIEIPGIISALCYLTSLVLWILGLLSILGVKPSPGGG